VWAVEVSAVSDPASGRSLTAFAGVFGSALLAFLAVGCVLPVLPRYVHGPLHAGDVWVGVVTGAFAFTAVVARPVAGRLADRRGRRAVVSGGALLVALGGALYFIPGGVPSLLVARLVLGAGEGAVFTAGATWVVDLAPVARRGQAIGLFGLAVWGALSAGPLIGEGLFQAGGYSLVWAFATVSPLVGVVLALRQPGGAPAAEALARPPLLLDAVPVAGPDRGQPRGRGAARRRARHVHGVLRHRRRAGGAAGGGDCRARRLSGGVLGGDRVRRPGRGADGDDQSTSRRSAAQRLSSCRLESCSLRRTALTCASTVFALIPSRSAISL
jgi:MFS family permease